MGAFELAAGVVGTFPTVNREQRLLSPGSGNLAETETQILYRDDHRIGCRGRTTSSFSSGR
jgi:hypothetical protein